MHISHQCLVMWCDIFLTLQALRYLQRNAFVWLLQATNLRKSPNRDRRVRLETHLSSGTVRSFRPTVSRYDNHSRSSSSSRAAYTLPSRVETSFPNPKHNVERTPKGHHFVNKHYEIIDFGLLLTGAIGCAAIFLIAPCTPAVGFVTSFYFCDAIRTRISSPTFLQAKAASNLRHIGLRTWPHYTPLARWPR